MSSVLQLQLAVTAQDRSNYFAVIGLICAVNYHLELKNVFVYFNPISYNRVSLHFLVQKSKGNQVCLVVRQKSMKILFYHFAC